jgi:hypothetical protein
MIHDPPATAPDSLFAPRAALRLGLALVLGIALVTVLAVLDRNRRTQDETHEEVTAVGDQSFFKLPEVFPKPPEAAVVFHGQSLYPVYKRITNRDSSMIRVGEDDSRTYWIYTDRVAGKEAAAEGEKKGAPAYYLKAALDEYFEVRAQR